MKQEELFEVIGEVDGTFIKEATEQVCKKSKRVWVKWVATAACLCLLVTTGVFVWPKEPGEIRLSHSSGNWDAKYVTEDYLAQKELFSVSDETEAIHAVYKEENLFTTINSKIDTHLIVKGTVTDVRPVEIINESLSDEFPEELFKYIYGAIVELKVEKVYRGDCKVNDTLELWYYSGTKNAYHTCDFEVGDTGIFMPGIYNDQAVYEGWSLWAEEDVIDLTDLADYEISKLFAFLETEEGMDFARWQFVGAKDAATFEEVEEYIYRMVELYPTGLE